ncbi:MAG: class I SAM-dependent methyltransferase [Pseudonocardiaceae bacterium]
MPETAVNSEQVTMWNGDEGRLWVKHEQRHELMLSRVTPHLWGAAAVLATDTVLDIGCGSGATTRAAARHAHRASALGVDLSDDLLGLGRRRAVEEGLNNVTFERADAQVHDFRAAGFDVAISRFGVMFFDNPAAAFANVARAVRRGGRLAFLCWQALVKNAWLATPLRAIAAHIPPPEFKEDAPGPFSLADPQRIHGLLDGAGFTDVQIQSVTEPARMGSDAADVVGYLQERSGVRSLLSAADADTAARALDAMRAAMAPYQTPEGVLVSSAAWLVTARR